MEPEFQRMMIRVIVAGLVIIGGGTTALYVAFRSFEKKGSSRAFLWLMGLTFGIIVVCALLWRLSYGPE